MEQEIITTNPLTERERVELRFAKSLLENPGHAARLANLLGAPLERGFQMLPRNWSGTVQKATRAALLRALSVSVATLGRARGGRSANTFHKIMVGASGGIGGAFGLAALPVELPVSTTLMLRSIADVARSEGHDLRDVETRLACLEVFALGGPSKKDDAAENAYWAVRAVLAKSVTEAARYLAQRGAVDEAAPAVVRLIAAIASRFGVVVSEQVAAKAVPVVGAAAGSLINIMFMDHFQQMARGHFIVRRLEMIHGTEAIRALYQTLAYPMEKTAVPPIIEAR